MSKYNVTLYPIVMVRFPSIEADTPEQARQLAEAGLASAEWSCTEGEWAEQDGCSQFTPCVDELDPDTDEMIEDKMDLLYSDE